MTEHIKNKPKLKRRYLQIPFNAQFEYNFICLDTINRKFISIIFDFIEENVIELRGCNIKIYKYIIAIRNNSANVTEHYSFFK